MTGVKYFAYGSNMSANAMAAACPAHRFLGPACLPDHRLAFTRRSIRTGTGVADVVPARGSEVWGALYEIPQDGFQALDRKEGAGWAYDKATVTVRKAAGDEEVLLEAVTYSVAQKEPAEVAPAAEYVKQLIAGAKARGVPAHYVRFLARLTDRVADDDQASRKS
jgi:gamma-glutamylcyclotransferase (GGCT)/AIG2-like uncharacterized protein YtfP